VSTLNLGILAHVDAGKTSLTERLLFDAGVTTEIGSVDSGSTQTDSLPLERLRGITIKSAVASFAIGDLHVNLIDTPGHPDFIAEVERVLAVLDGAVLVISAVEGVQPQTRILMRTLRRLRIPAVLYVNKIDCLGARDAPVLADIAARLTPAIVSLGQPHDLGTRRAGFTPFEADDPGFTARLADVLTEQDDRLLAAYVDDPALVSPARLRERLVAQARHAQVHPVFFGSALTGAGTGALAAGIAEFLPPAGGDPSGPVSGTVFAIERGPAGEKIAWARLFSGTIGIRDRVRYGQRRGGTVTGIRLAGRTGSRTVPGHPAPAARDALTAGRIGALRGLDAARLGDPLGVAEPAPRGRQFAPPTLETVVAPARPADKGALHGALAQLAEQDPLINLGQDDVTQQLTIWLYGEVQKEVIAATLAADFGLPVRFAQTTIIRVERLVGTGQAAESMGAAGNPFRATVGLRLDPAPPGSGVRFRLGIERGALPAAFRKAVEQAARQTLRQGLRGWPVPDCAVTLTHSGYTPPPPSGWSKWSSSASDFRHLTPLVVMAALRRAGTSVHEPVHRFRLEAPVSLAGQLLPAVARLGAAPRAPAVSGPVCCIEGEIPGSRLRGLESEVPALTGGEGLLESEFVRYRPVRGTVPVRQRTGPDPLNRDEYLLRVARGLDGERGAAAGSAGG
jgi:ribosomal protection tetracycline resistance protein